MTKPRRQLVTIGAILGAHGVRGDVRVRSFTADPISVFEYGPLLSETGSILLEPKRVRPSKDHFIVTPCAPREKEAWDALKGQRLHVPRDVLPPVEDDEFYIDDLVGLDVLIGGDEKIGTVKAVLNHGAGDLIEIHAASHAKPVLVPFTQVDVPVIDLKQGRIIVATFELWADETKPDEAD
ncbi:MAG: ribosome maturation factor RimM [Pseudomonadota bacterium]